MSNSLNLGNLSTGVNIFNNADISAIGSQKIIGDLTVTNNLNVDGNVNFTYSDSGGLIEHPIVFEDTATFESTVTCTAAAPLICNGPAHFNTTCNFNGTLNVNAGIVGNLQGNASGSAAYVTEGSQPNITNLPNVENLSVVNTIQGTAQNALNAQTANTANSATNATNSTYATNSNKLYVNNLTLTETEKYYAIFTPDTAQYGDCYVNPTFYFTPNTQVTTAESMTIDNYLNVAGSLNAPPLSSGGWLNIPLQAGYKQIDKASNIAGTLRFQISKIGRTTTINVSDTSGNDISFTPGTSAPLICDLSAYPELAPLVDNANFTKSGWVTPYYFTTGCVLTINQALNQANFTAGTAYTVLKFGFSYVNANSTT